MTQNNVVPQKRKIRKATDEVNETRPQKEIVDAISYEMERQNSTSGMSVASTNTTGTTTTDQSASVGLDVDTKFGQPANFGVVVPGVYRCSYPKESDYAFIEGLKLKTIVTLVDKELPETYQPFIQSNGIRHHVVKMKGTKKEEIPTETMKSILQLVLDQQNYPLLLHCNHGRHRTGCVVAVVRKLSGWKVPDILAEYKSYAEPKIRDCDLKYIERFDLASLSALYKQQKRSRLRVRVHKFVRNVIVTFVVLLIWLISFRKLIAPQREGKRYLEVHGSAPSS